jgi:D-3-phosphoglycerate dehydrogenase
VNLPKLVVVGQAVVTPTIKREIHSGFEALFLKKSEFFSNAKHYIGESDVVWVHVDTPILSEMSGFFRDDHILATTSTGTTHISKSIRQSLGSRLVTLKSQVNLLQGITSTSELAWAMVLSGLTGLVGSSRETKQGKWDRMNHLRPKQVSSSEIGILGFGRLGKVTARYAREVVSEIWVWDILEEAREEARLLGYKVPPHVEAMYGAVDAISVHVNVGEIERAIIGLEQVKSFKPGMILVNTSRGILIDEHAIIWGIQHGRVSQYLTDVLSCEDDDSPIEESRLWKFSHERDSVIITPHIGGASLDAMYKCEKNILCQIKSKLTELSL